MKFSLEKFSCWKIFVGLVSRACLFIYAYIHIRHQRNLPSKNPGYGPVLVPLFSLAECNCSLVNSVSNICGADGGCVCRPGATGMNCQQCMENHFQTLQGCTGETMVIQMQITCSKWSEILIVFDYSIWFPYWYLTYLRIKLFHFSILSMHMLKLTF